jgi:hypothetical protein
VRYIVVDDFLNFIAILLIFVRNIRNIPLTLPNSIIIIIPTATTTTFKTTVKGNLIPVYAKNERATAQTRIHSVITHELNHILTSKK